MVFTAAQRAEIAENDPTWLFKFRIRAVLTILLFIPLGCLANVASFSSNFQTSAFQYDTRTWPCLLMIILALIWNLITVAIYTKWKRPLNPLIQLIIHGLLTFLFIIIGAVATHNAAVASSLVKNDPYTIPSGDGNKQAGQGYTVRADNGSTVRVTADNVGNCPAFTSCTAQEAWMLDVQHRASVAITGCVIFLLLIPVQLLLTIVYLRDYRIRRANAERFGLDGFQMNNTPFDSQHLKQPYGGADNGSKGPTSQVNLLHEGRGGLGFHKPNYANDSVLSVATSDETNNRRPSTADTARSRPRFMRPKSNGPGLPLSLSLSRAGSQASTIASRRRKSNASTFFSRRRSADTSKDLPPVPTIDTSKLRSSTSDSMMYPQTPDTAILMKSPTSPPQSGRRWEELHNEKSLPGVPGSEKLSRPEKAARKEQLPTLRKPLPPKLSIFPSDEPLSPQPLTSPKTPTTGSNLNMTANVSPAATARTMTTTSKFSQPKSPTHDPFSPMPFDHDELSALPVIPPEGLPRISKDTSRPTSPLGSIGDMDILRSLRGTLFASDPDAAARSRSSYASGPGSPGRSSPFGRSHSPISFQSGGSGRASPWRMRQERREVAKELEREQQQRERELAEAEQRAHRAAEKMESAYLRDEIRGADDKAAMRKKTIEDRIQRLKDTLEDLKRVQDEEELKREDQERKEEDGREAGLHEETATYGNVVAARVVEHRRQESIAQSIEAGKSIADSRPTTRAGSTRPNTSNGKGKERESSESNRTEKALPPVPPTPIVEEPDSAVRYSWETGRTVAQTKADAPG